MTRKKRRAVDGGHGNAERWLLTYSDMITLLMAFFIMMYSMSVLNLAKFQQVAISIRSGFGGVLRGGDHLMSSPPGEPSLVHLNPLRETKVVKVELVTKKMTGASGDFAQEQLKLASYIITHNLQGKVTLSSDTRGIKVTILSDGVLFDRGAAEIRPEQMGLLAHVAGLIKAVPNKVMVEGHTCNLPISSARFPSNWELSSARASQVVRYFIGQQGIDPTRLGAVGYADTQPVAPNDAEPHRRLNRRVVIVVMNDMASPFPTTGEEPTTSSEQPTIVKVKPILEKVWKESTPRNNSE